MTAIKVVLILLCLIVAFLCHVVAKLVERTDALKKKIKDMSDETAVKSTSAYMVNSRLAKLEKSTELLQQEYIINSNKISRLFAETRAKKDISVFDSR